MLQYKVFVEKRVAKETEFQKGNDTGRQGCYTTTNI